MPSGLARRRASFRTSGNMFIPTLRRATRRATPILIHHSPAVGLQTSEKADHLLEVRRSRVDERVWTVVRSRRSWWGANSSWGMFSPAPVRVL
jgi:hypothetical protein